jgi:hypothetical protein
MTELNDSKWLLARERGEDVSHVPAYTRERYSQLDQMIQDLPTCAPSPGWKQRVLDSLDDPLIADRPRIFPLATARSRVAPPHRALPPPRRWPWAVAPGVAASLAAVFAVCAYMGELGAPERGSRDRREVVERGHANAPSAVRATFDDPEIELLQATADDSPTAPFATTRLGVRRAARRRGAHGPNLGDTLVIEMAADRPIELRVYGDTGDPLARCTDVEGCRVERVAARWTYHLELVLRAPGAVHTVEYTGGAMPAALRDLDEDLQAARRAGVSAREISVVHVE